MSFQTHARRVRDPELPIGLRYTALRSAVACYRRLRFNAAWAFATGTEAVPPLWFEGPVLKTSPARRPRLDEDGLLKALGRIDASRTAWLAETAAFAERRTALKRLRIPADPAEVRYRSHLRWPGPDAHEAAVVAVAYELRRLESRRAGLQTRAPEDPIAAAFAPIVDAYLGGGLDAAERRRLRGLIDRMEAWTLGQRAEHWAPPHPLWHTAELIRNDVLPLVRRGWTGDAARVAEVFWAARSGMAYLPALHTYDETAWWVGEVMVPSSELWIAERHGAPVGFAALNGDRLDHLYVAPDAQGLGVGEALLAKAKRRRRSLDLRVFEQNLGARAFYARHGFIAVGGGSDNEEGLPDLHLRWRGQSQS